MSKEVVTAKPEEEKTSSALRSLDSVQDHHVGFEAYELPITPDTPYVVDDSSFVPMAEAVKQLGIIKNFTGSENPTAFDFPNGKDNGMAMPINRTKDGKDIAELSTAVNENNEAVNSELERVKRMEDYKNSLKSDNASPSASGES